MQSQTQFKNSKNADTHVGEEGGNGNLREKDFKDGGTWTRGFWQNEGIYSGCMGWIHAPPPSLATPQYVYDFPTF
jgi:hypothetical protein